MAARRCSLCGIMYPNVSHFTYCPIHGDRTVFRPDSEPDEDWKVRVDRMLKQAETDAAVNRDLPYVAGVSVVEDGGELFVSQTALQRAGLRLSRMMPDQFYLFELDDGWVYETQGWDDPRRRWWVARVVQSMEGR